jgi:uncharacterized protein (DUF2344 family)
LAVALEADTDISEAPDWQSWLEDILRREAITWEHTTKSGKKKQVNLRDRLFDLKLAEAAEIALMPSRIQGNKMGAQAIIRYRGSCRNDGTLLRPEHVAYMLEQAAGMPIQLLHAHRLRLILQAVSVAA